jgi:hypothetical protein
MPNGLQSKGSGNVPGPSRRMPDSVSARSGTTLRTTLVRYLAPAGSRESGTLVLVPNPVPICANP